MVKLFIAKPDWGELRIDWLMVSNLGSYLEKEYGLLKCYNMG